MKRFVKAIVALSSLIALFGCGGGGGGSTVSPAPIPAQATTAVLKVSTQGVLPTGTSIAGVGITVNLPLGVTVKTDATGKVAADVVVASGVMAGKATMTDPVYVAPTATAPGSIKFVLASTETAGVGTGEFVTVTCDIATGSSPQATDFSLADFKPVNLNGAPITGLTATFTADIK